MASSSTASSYDVYLNHRGPDVKDGLASDLYRGLVSHGLKVFLDKPEMQVGNSITAQIEEAIRTASVHVVIFSPRYAESHWILDELLLILESKDATIIPVFYLVKPSDLRLTTDENSLYGRSLQALAERYDPNIIESWRKALYSVSLISGFYLEACNGDDGELADIVIKEVLQKVQNVPGSHAYVAEYRAGLDEKVKEFENEVFFKHHESARPPQVVGIVGLGGVGKTTLAKEFFDRKTKLSHNSRKSCFLSNVRENKGDLTSLQIRLLKILTGSNVPIHRIDQGKEALEKSLSSSSVLLVLDDVDDVDQIDALVPVRTNIHSESLIVITTRDEEVIKKAPIYHLTRLNEEHSLELFCAYAFKRPSAPIGFESLVNDFLKFCVGLPLFLKLFGSLLSEKKYQSEWEEVLHGLPKDREKSLQIFYYTLNTEQQQMFLDCACFFRGQKRDTAIRIWDGSGWEGRRGFQTLQKRCLLEVDIENIIHMHDHLRDFGRALAVTSYPRRLWNCTHMNAMLEQLPVTSVRGIRMVLGEYKDDVDAFGRIDMSKLQLVDTENAILERILGRPMHFPNLLWFRWNKCPETSMASWIPEKNLRVLQVSGSELRTLWEDEPQAPLELRELEVNAPLSNIPKSIGLLGHLESIVIGGILSGQVNLTKLPEEFCSLQSLKTLVLTECSKMKSLPDSFAHLKNLQHINFSFCRNLERLPDSFGDLGRLQHINLSYCHDLEELPDSICRLRRLQHIDLRGCHNLESLPDSFVNSFVNLKDEEFHLRRINLSGCHDLERLPDSFGNFIYLQHIDLQGCHNLEKIPNSFGNLKNLEHINLSNCHDLEKLPESFGNLTNLQYIDLSGCHNLERLPNYFRNLTKLKYLDVEGCSNLIIETLELSDHLGVAQKRQLEQLYLSDAEPVLPEMRNGKLKKKRKRNQK